MKKEGSTASMLWLDICRGFCSKRFWGIVGGSYNCFCSVSYT